MDNSPFYDNDNKKKRIGCFKDEASGVIIREFIVLRSKMYSYIKDNNENNKTAKGIKKIVIKKDIRHDDHKNTLFKGILKFSPVINLEAMSLIDQFRYIKIKTITINTIDLSTRLWGITSKNSVVIPQSLVTRSIVLG